MNIAILGTGTMAAAVGTAWRAAGHDITVAGRDPDKAAALAARLGADVRAAAPVDAVKASDAVLLAVSPGGVEELLGLAGGPDGALDGTVVIDCTNTFEYPSGRRDPAQRSAAERAADAAPGSRVVKALTMFAGESWLNAPDDAPPRTVVMCGDDPDALEVAEGLVRDLGGIPAVLGGLDRAGQIEEVAGFVVGLYANGVDPTTALPALEVTANDRPSGPVATQAMWNVFTRDPQRAVRFYAGVLGLAIASQFPDPANPVHTVLRAGATPLAITIGGPADVGLTPDAQHPAELVVWCADVDALAARAAEHGASVLVQPYDHVAGHRRAYVTDPDGNWVALVDA